MPRIVNALFIAGLSYNNANINPTLFTDGPLDATTISSLSPLTTSTNIVQALATAGISGATARINDLRDPLISASSPTASIQDTMAGTYSAFFAPDPGWANTTRWIVHNTGTVLKSATSIILSGPTAPTVNQLVYLGNETIRIDAVTTTARRHVHTCTVTRGVAGSRAVTHSLDPSTYPPGDDGSREALVVYSRRVYDGNRKIEAALYQFKMSDSNPHAIDSVLFAWYGYLAGVPKQNTEYQWQISVKHFAQALTEHQMRGGEPIDLAHCIQITNLSTGYGAGVGNNGSSSGGYVANGPQEVIIRLTVYEFERLFNVIARAHRLSNFAAEASLNAINTLLQADGRVYFEIVGEVGGHTWVWRVTQIDADFSSNLSASKGAIPVHCTFVAASPKADATDSPANYPPYDDFTYDRNDDLNQGFTFSNNVSENRVRIEQGETPPKLSCRLRLSPCTFVDAALMLILSGYGSGSNHATYDLIPGGRGMQFNPDWVNIGSTPADALAVSSGTQVWLEQLALDEETYNYAFTHETKLGEWFKNELLLRNMLFCFVPSTGKVCVRTWLRSDTVTALKPVTYPVTDVDASNTLPEQRVVLLERGIDPVTLEPKFRKPLQDMDARSSDYSNAPTVRIWKQGGAITDNELQTGNLGLFLRAVFGVGIGTPRVFAVPLAIDASTTFGDLVTWSDPFVPTATGRGFTARNLIVLGIDPNPSEFIKYVYCVEDLLNISILGNVEDDATTVLGHALKIDGIVAIDTTARTAQVSVMPFDPRTFRTDTSNGGVWADIVTYTGVVSVRNEKAHNPTAAGERFGFEEMYVTVTDATFDNKAHKNYLSLSWTAAMGATRLDPDEVIALGSIIQLPDYRPASAAPSSVDVLPITDQGYLAGAGANITHIGALSRLPRFDGRRSLIGS